MKAREAQRMDGMAMFIANKTKQEVIKAYGKECAVIQKVTGGWMIFTTLYDYCVWSNQK
jgi:hypothetical protein